MLDINKEISVIHFAGLGYYAESQTKYDWFFTLDLNEAKLFDSKSLQEFKMKLEGSVRYNNVKIVDKPVTVVPRVVTLIED